MTPEQISAWPGKMIDGRTHPTLWHMLDVGAVATCLMAHRSLTGSDASDQAAAFLVTLHDLGKFSASFRAMLRGQPYRGLRHWQHSYRLLRDHDGVLGKVIGATPGPRKMLYTAVAGHHGGPPAHLDNRKHKDQAAQIGAEASRVAREAIEAVAPLFPKASLGGITESEACRLCQRPQPGGRRHRALEHGLPGTGGASVAGHRKRGRQPPAPSVATGLGAHQPDGRLQLAAEQAS